MPDAYVDFYRTTYYYYFFGEEGHNVICLAAAASTFRQGIQQSESTVAPGSRRLLRSQMSRAKQLVAMNVASGIALLVE